MHVKPYYSLSRMNAIERLTSLVFDCIHPQMDKRIVNIGYA